MEEQQYCEEINYTMIESGVNEIYKGKKSNWIMNLLLWGFCIVLFTVMIAVMPVTFELRDVRGYEGSRPTYEDAEAKIINRLFDVKFVLPEIDSDLVHSMEDPSKAAFYYASMGHYEINQVMEPEEFDYTSLDFRKTGGLFNSTPQYIHSDLKKTNMYKEATAKAKELFEAEMDRRESIAQSMIWSELSIVMVIAGIYTGFALLLLRYLEKKKEKHLDQIRSGKARVIPVTMIGRQEYNSRYSHTKHIEVCDDTGKKMTVKVTGLQYNRFESGKACYAITYPELEADTDPEYYDLVWDGLTTQA